jgi:hypothetical protein
VTKTQGVFALIYCGSMGVWMLFGVLLGYALAGC